MRTEPMSTEPWDATVLQDARIEIFEDLQSCEGLWREATRRCAHTVFQTYDWIAAWQDALGASSGCLSYVIVHVAGYDGATLLLLPCGIFKRFGSRCLEFLGGDLSDYNAPVIDRDLANGMSRRDFARLWRLLLARLSHSDWFNFRRMPPLIDGANNPFTNLPRSTRTASYSASLPQNFEAFAAGRSKNYFGQNRRHRRRLDKQGAVSFSFPDDTESKLSILHFILTKKALWQEKSGFSATFGTRGYNEFYERLTRFPLAHAEIVTAGLSVDGVIVAGLWGVIFRGNFHLLIMSYDEDWASFRVGRLLMEDTIRFCIKRNLQVFDLTTGDEPYKLNWADTKTPVFDHQSARTLIGATMLMIRGMKHGVDAMAASQPFKLLRRS